MAAQRHSALCGVARLAVKETVSPRPALSQAAPGQLCTDRCRVLETYYVLYNRESPRGFGRVGIWLVTTLPRVANSFAW